MTARGNVALFPS